MKDPFRLAIVVPTVVVIGLLAWISPGLAKTTHSVTVECAMGQTIEQALRMGDFDKPLVVTVRGKCIEYVTITRDDVTLQGDPFLGGEVAAPSTAASAITVRGASRVTIDRLTVTGGQHGVFASTARAVAVTNSTVRQASLNGVNALAGHVQVLGSKVKDAGQHGIALNASSALVRNSEITNNAGAGIHLIRNADINAGGNTVSANGSHGVEVLLGSVAWLGNNTISGNLMTGVFLSKSTADLIEMTVTNNKAHGVQAEMAKLAISNNSKINSNDGYGVFAHLGTVLSIVGNEISGNKASGIELQSSSGQLTGATIQNNSWYGIHMWLASKLFVHGPNNTSVAGNGYVDVWCEGGESSVFDTTFLPGATIIDCTGF